MWEQYRKTFLQNQIFIAAITAIIFFKMGRNPLMALTFLATMEVGAAVGAAWATRLKRMVRSRQF